MRFVKVLIFVLCAVLQAAPLAPAEAHAPGPAADARYWRQATANLRAGAGVALGVTGALPPAAPAPALRKSITALSAAEVASLRKGIAQMIAWNHAPRGSANFKRSLAYWANIHSFVGPNATPPYVCSKNAGLNNPGMSGLSIQAPTTPDEQATWCTCQHGTIQFLTWHRMYLYYFEKVLQAAAGDPSLRLPFWDYEQDGHIPDAYRLPSYVGPGGAQIANPLYVPSRQAQLADGSQALDPGVTSTAGAIGLTTYSDFQNAIEQTPHGAVHCATGVASCPSGYMGYVPTAGNDPVFYSHHANIDRLYDCWLSVAMAARLPSDPAQLAQTFSFIDGSGVLVTRTVGDMLTTAKLGYGYAAGAGCPAKRLLGAAPVRKDRPLQTIPLSGPVALRAGTTTVPVRITPLVRGPLLGVTAGGGATDGPRATLVIEGLAFDEIPATLYKIYLQGADGKRALVGVLNFFNATAPHDAMPGMATGAPGETRLDATGALAALGAGSGEATLVIEPSAGVTGIDPVRAAARISPRANVRFTASRIEVR